MKIYVENYGCTANRNNAEIIAGILSEHNNIVDSEEKADLVVVNTCVVKGPTENKIARRIEEIKKPVVVTGCMVDSRKEVLDKIRPDAILVSVNNISFIEKAIEQKTNFIDVKEREMKIKLPKRSFDKNIEILQICEGCLGNCAYCITKLAKGNLFSYPEEEIVKAIEKSKSKEIWLTSQDCGAYGRDIGTNLVNLLKKIVDIKKDFKIRIGMMN
ncbi:threonylcarbamoyladenosine tRNA methylthiotransferase, partial [Candidatus Woesearchaeota archaeon]|nr:threonylcarbamoyladenosine tRNA methylthiotransferase [Candidatus Woesearchaeota archaeon]